MGLHFCYNCFVSDKQKHLEFIQNVISRMAGNLFYLRGWTITLIAALFAFFVKEADKNPHYVYIAYLPAVICWVLDGYFLSQERLFRNLYDHVRKLDEKNIDYSMDTRPYQNKWRNSLLFCMFAPTLGIFYIPLLLIMIALTYFLTNL